jgi:hypothetical protein
VMSVSVGVMRVRCSWVAIIVLIGVCLARTLDCRAGNHCAIRIDRPQRGAGSASRVARIIYVVHGGNV